MFALCRAGAKDPQTLLYIYLFGVAVFVKSIAEMAFVVARLKFGGQTNLRESSSP